MDNRSKKGIILTVPEEIIAGETFYLTGNEYLSLPQIDRTGSIVSVNILHLGHRGLFEFCGSRDSPLLSPLLKIDGQQVDLEGLLAWRYHLDWLPSFTLETEKGLTLEGEIIAPPGFKGFYYSLSLQNSGGEPVTVQLGWQGCWDTFNFIIFNRREVEGKRLMAYNHWTRSFVLEASAGPPLAALAFASEPETEWQKDEKNGRYSLVHELRLEPGAGYEAVIYAAVNLESDGAGTTAVDLRRRGSAALKEAACSWLENRRSKLDDLDLSSLLNRNLFFSYFYALARSLDSEELVPVTSRSPRYYVSAAFWSRDTLLWSFPAIMMADQNTARELLMAVFQRHVGNAGDHAHYISGTVLYPGFELDQLAAYFIALEHYILLSGEDRITEETVIRKGLNILAEKALDSFDPESGLYGTFLDPSDDPVSFPFLTYNNALLHRSFSFLAKLQEEEWWQHKSDFAILARELQHAIYEHCTVKGPFGMMFAWAVDGKGRFSLYDNPPGSLQLLAHYGFCLVTDTIFKNTVHWIRSSNNKHYHEGSRFEESGSLHAGNPWPLSACNDLLACNIGGVDFFRRTEMDNGFFCETVNPETGRVSTGAAFASGAGFLAYALKNRVSESGCLGPG